MICRRSSGATSMSIVHQARFGKLLGVVFFLLAGLPGSALHGQEVGAQGTPGVPNLGLTDRVKDMGKPEPSHGELVLQGLEQVRGFGLDRQTDARQKALAGYIPEGRDVKVVFLYSVRKVVRGEAPEITLLDDVYPEKIQVLQEPASVRNLEYKQEEVVIHG